MSEPRRRIRNQVHATPGIHFNELGRTLGLAPGQLQHHIRRLLADGRVTSERLYGRTHYYPPSYDAWERGALALLERETTRGILVVLLDSGPTRPVSLADELEVARSTIEHHLTHLEAQGVVEKRRKAGNRVMVTLTRPARTAELLRTIEPSIAARLSDRFERLLDELLDPDG